MLIQIEASAELLIMIGVVICCPAKDHSSYFFGYY